MMNEGALHELSAGWVWTRLEEVCLYPQYGWTTSAKTEGALYLLRTTDITSGDIDWNTVPFCKEEPSEKEKYLLKDGDIVISRAGSVGYSHLIKNPKEAIFASYLIRFRPLIDEKYLAFFLKSPFYWKSISEKSLGIAIPNVNASKLKQISIPLPPLPEQRAIVSKIEQLFSDLDNGIENVKKAQAQLKLYRQSVLKAACEGKLVPTEAELARAERRDYEAADVLLARILKERREKWNGKGKYKEAAAPDSSNISNIYEGWTWVTIDQICALDVGFAFKSSEFAAEGIRLLRGDNMEPGSLRWSDTRYWPKEKLASFEHLLIKEGDIILAMDRPIISSGLKIARAKASDIPCLLVQRMARFRSIEPEITRFLFCSLQTLSFMKHLQRGQTGTQLPHISATGILSFVIPLPPLAEQRRIVAEVERRLSVSDKMEATITESLQKAESLRQSILKKAFEGKLLNKKELEKVRNASDWEPAEKLLERISKEKAQTGEKKRKR